MPLIGSPWHNPDWGYISKYIRQASRAAFGSPDDAESVLGVYLATKKIYWAMQVWFQKTGSHIANAKPMYIPDKSIDSKEVKAKAHIYVSNMEFDCLNIVEKRFNVIEAKIKKLYVPECSEEVLNTLLGKIGTELVRAVQDSRVLLASNAMSNEHGRTVSCEYVTKLRIIDELHNDLDYAFDNFKLEESQLNLLSRLFNLPLEMLRNEPSLISKHRIACDREASDQTPRGNALLKLDKLIKEKKVATRATLNKKYAKAVVIQMTHHAKADEFKDEDEDEGAEENKKKSSKSRLENKDVNHASKITEYSTLLTRAPFSVGGSMRQKAGGNEDDEERSEITFECDEDEDHSLIADYDDEVPDLLMSLLAHTQKGTALAFSGDDLKAIRQVREGQSKNKRMPNKPILNALLDRIVFSPPRIKHDEATTEQKERFGEMVTLFSARELELIQSNAVSSVKFKATRKSENNSRAKAAIRLSVDKLTMKEQRLKNIAAGMPEVEAQRLLNMEELEWFESLSQDDMAMLTVSAKKLSQKRKAKSTRAKTVLVETMGWDLLAELWGQKDKGSNHFLEIEAKKQKTIFVNAVRAKVEVDATKYLELFGPAPEIKE